MRALAWMIVLYTGALAASAAAGVVGPAVEVASKVKGTRRQMWPRAAWCEGSKTWLVAWREGLTNEGEADIWCGRVSADGKAVDPAGIRVTSAKHRQERPSVVSDGKGFLVVWEDFRNGKDWDVYAARVSSDGKVLDPEGVLVAGGKHNQCRPVVAFAGGNYLVAWQAFRGDGVPGDPGTGYILFGARVSPEGKVLDAGGVLLADAGGKAHADNAVAAAAGNRVLVGHLMVSYGGNQGHNYAGLAAVDAATCKPDGPVLVFGPSIHAMYPGLFVNHHRLPALAWGRAGGLFAAPSKGLGLHLWRLDANGKEAGPPQEIGGNKMLGLVPLFSLAFDGEQYLLTMDRPIRRGRDGAQIKVYGLYLDADGKLPKTKISEKDFLQTAFVIAGEGDKDQMQGFACAGPKSVCLVAYVENRGADDLKVMARLVRAK